MMVHPAATPADRATPPVNDDDDKVRPLDNEDSSSQPEIEDRKSAPEKDSDQDAVPGPKESRADRVEALASSRLNKSREEMTEANETFTKVEAPKVEPEPVDPNSRVELRVNRQPISMTLAQRDELASSYYEGDVADLTDKERNKYAQMELADRKFAERKRENRNEPEEPQRQPQQPAPREPVKEEPKRETPDDKRDRALEIIQMGGDRSEANRLLREAEDERLEEKLSHRDQEAESNRINSLIARNYMEGRAEAERQYGEALRDPVVRSTVESMNGVLQATVIANCIANLDVETRTAFERGGITPAYLQSLTPEDATVLYKDMLTKGYKLPPPGNAYVVAAKLVSEKFGSTQPPPSDTQPSDQPDPAISVDRKGRKEGLATPERTTVPRQVPGRSGPPPSEQQRAANSRQELRQSRMR